MDVAVYSDTIANSKSNTKPSQTQIIQEFIWKYFNGYYVNPVMQGSSFFAGDDKKGWLEFKIISIKPNHKYGFVIRNKTKINLLEKPIERKRVIIKEKKE